MALDGLSTMHPTIVNGPTWPSSNVEHQNLVRPKHANAKRLFPFSQTSHQPFRLSSVVGQPGPVEKKLNMQCPSFHASWPKWPLSSFLFLSPFFKGPSLCPSSPVGIGHRCCISCPGWMYIQGVGCHHGDRFHPNLGTRSAVRGECGSCRPRHHIGDMVVRLSKPRMSGSGSP